MQKWMKTNKKNNYMKLYFNSLYKFQYPFIHCFAWIYFAYLTYLTYLTYLPYISPYSKIYKKQIFIANKENMKKSLLKICWKCILMQFKS